MVSKTKFMSVHLSSHLGKLSESPKEESLEEAPMRQSSPTETVD